MSRSVPATATSTAPGDRHHLIAYPTKTFTAVRASGARIETKEGRTLIDLGGGNHGVAVLGHNHPRIAQAICAQTERMIHVSQAVVTEERAAFLERLHAHLPAALTRTFITNSGTEGIECAIKLAVAATGRHGLVGAVNGFHGRSLGALRLTHKPDYRAPWLPLIDGTRFVPFNDVDALHAAVDEEVAAVVLEPIQGEGGIVAATREYLRAARDITTEHGALLVLDEVQTGMGRTGTFLACEDAGVVPDIVVLGKGLAGGVPVGTCSVSEDVAASLPPAGHGSTYGGNPLATAAGAAALDVLREEDLVARAGHVGERFRRALGALDDPLIREVRGRGLMLGVDLRIRPGPVLRALEERGFLALSAGRTAVRFLPPLIVDEVDLEAAVAAMSAALAEVGPSG